MSIDTEALGQELAAQVEAAADLKALVGQAQEALAAN
jgi:hypothetical protein